MTFVTRAGDASDLNGVLSIYPEGQAAVSSMNAKVFHEGILDPAVRALVAATAAAEWSDPIQVAEHLGTFAAARGVSLEDAQAQFAAPDASGFEPAVQALLTYSSKAATDAFKMVPKDVDALTEAGWDERQIVEALTVVCVAGYNAVANLALGITALGITGPATDGSN